MSENDYPCHEYKSTKDIGFAVRALKEGKCVTRSGWNGRNMWLAWHAPEFSRGDPKLMSQYMTLPYIYMRTAQGDFVPWLCSQTDLLAEDWEVV